MTETIVSPTVNDSGASYVIKLGGVTDADGTVSLAVGANVITVEVTAEDGSTTQTYRVTVTRAEPPSTDATLKGLTLSEVDFGIFDSTTTSYSTQVANSLSQTTVTPVVNDSGASRIIKIGGVTDADGTVPLAVGSNVITVEVTAEDDSTTQTYTVTVTRAEPPSTDATLKGLTLSDVNFGTFSSATTSYTAQVANSVTQTTVTPTVNDSGASHIIKIGGVTDADGKVSLSVGTSVITVVVTAEDGVTTRTYTVTVTRAESSTSEKSSDATLKSLALSGIDFGTFDSTTTSYSTQVSNSVSQTIVTPAANAPGASYVIKLGGVIIADGKVSLDVGNNVITVDVAAEDGETTKTYTITVTRTEPPSTDATAKHSDSERREFWHIRFRDESIHRQRRQQRIAHEGYPVREPLRRELRYQARRSDRRGRNGLAIGRNQRHYRYGYCAGQADHAHIHLNRHARRTAVFRCDPEGADPFRSGLRNIRLVDNHI